MERKRKLIISENLIKIGNNVKKLRVEKGFSQMDLAFYSDLEKSTISNIERFSLDNVTIKTLVKISVVLEVDINHLFV